MTSTKHKKIETAFVFIINIVLILAVIAIFVFYMKDSQNKLFQKNLNDITNINQAAANISSEFFSSQERKLNDTQKYVKTHQMSLEELLKYLDESNASSETSYQIIGKDYKGYVISKDRSGNFTTVDYSAYDYANVKTIVDKAKSGLDTISFSAEFTDKISGERSFARYTYITVTDENGVEDNYTLMAVSKSEKFYELIDISVGYSRLSTALINENGDYLLRNNDFKSENFFEYIYLYNGFTLDEMNQLQSDFIKSGNGSFQYKNSRDENCVYVYVSIPETEWYSVSCVPVATFHESNLEIKYTVVLIVVLTMIMLVDFFWLARLNIRLKISADDAQNANEAKTDFLSRMSHDIRTPINVINGMTELAMLENNPAPTSQYLANIQSSGKFLLGLVNDILDMNKVESGKMELHEQPYRYSEFKSYILAIMNPLCESKNIEFKMTCNVNDASIVVDSLRLNQIFFNLLSNSAKFTHNNGHVSLDIHTTLLDENQAKIMFTVTDDGIGMSDDFQKEMFTAFSREDSTQVHEIQGTGLGLAIVKSIVDLMDGTIEVKSKLNEGTTFIVTIEREIIDGNTGSQVNEIDDTILANKNVLLCEDHPLNAQIITRLLGVKEMSVDVAQNGQVGIDFFSSHEKNYYSAILMDIRMPVMDGIEATKKIRKLKEHNGDKIPIIALTANAYDSDVENCLNAGMNAHLAKPIESKLLYSSLCKYLGEIK